MLKVGYFVTGTDTAVGKTVVATVLTVGLKATYWKPIQTGASEGTDSAFVRTWVGSPYVAAECYVYDAPSSPHLAAHAAGETIDPARILREAAGIPFPVIVEGAGGVLVPINPEFVMVDLMLALGLPAIVVASTRLGTINHTLLTLEALQRRKIRVAGVVMAGEERASSWQSIERYGGAKVLGHIPPTQQFTHSWFHEAYAGLSIPVSPEVPCPTN